MKNIFLTGASGFLGSSWYLKKKKKYRFLLGYNNTKINVIKKNKILTNVNNLNKIKKSLEKFRPEFIIHTAGITSVEFCEMNKRSCYINNFILTKELVKICNRINCKFVYISSDHLYSGNKSFYTESAKTKPLNYFAETKILSENFIKQKSKSFLIVRTNFIGNSLYSKKSFLNNIINSLKEKKKLFLFKDVFFTPIRIDLLIDTVHRLLDLNAEGVYNVVGDQRISKYQFGLKVAKVFKIKSKLIYPKNFKSFNLVKRPLDMSLSNLKLKRILKVKKIENINEALIKIRKCYNGTSLKNLKKFIII
jgi:dTDP-4-dehydrorhamnose reductase